VVLVPDDCVSTLFSRGELKHLLDEHSSFCDIVAQVVFRRAAALVRADPCRRAAFRHLVLPEAVREQDDADDPGAVSLYLPSLLFSPSLFPDPVIDMAASYAAGPVLVAAALARDAKDPDLAAVNATLRILRRHAANATAGWEEDFVRRACFFLDCRDSELLLLLQEKKAQDDPEGRAERYLRLLLPPKRV
jgi:hypothetical protein